MEDITYQEVNKILSKYGIDYKINKNISLFRQAFRHVSVCVKLESYERLEFIGDAALKLIITNYIYDRFKYENEGFLTKLRSRIERKETLIILSKALGLDKYVKFLADTKRVGEVKSIYADVFESFIGCVFKVAGLDVCSKLVIAIIETEIDVSEILQKDDNYKTQLVQAFHKRKLGTPIYSYILPVNSKEFKVTVQDSNNRVLGIGTGGSKKKGEQMAAYFALIELAK